MQGSKLSRTPPGPLDLAGADAGAMRRPARVPARVSVLAVLSCQGLAGSPPLFEGLLFRWLPLGWPAMPAWLCGGRSVRVCGVLRTRLVLLLGWLGGRVAR